MCRGVWEVLSLPSSDLKSAFCWEGVCIAMLIYGVRVTVSAFTRSLLDVPPVK
jgi:hypothetical protein